MDLIALAERVEKAEGPDPALDEAVAKAIGVKAWFAAGNRDWHFTASLDAAMTLVPEGWPSVIVGTTDDRRGHAALAGNDGHMMAEDPDEFYFEAEAATPALALTAAALRARASN